MLIRVSSWSSSTNQSPLHKEAALFLANPTLPPVKGYSLWGLILKSVLAKSCKIFQVISSGESSKTIHSQSVKV